MHVDPDEALAATMQKFRDRFGFIERTLQQQGRSLDVAALDEMELLWQQAKKN